MKKRKTKAEDEVACVRKVVDRCYPLMEFNGNAEDLKPLVVDMDTDTNMLFSRKGTNKLYYLIDNRRTCVHGYCEGSYTVRVHELVYLLTAAGLITEVQKRAFKEWLRAEDLKVQKEQDYRKVVELCKKHGFKMMVTYV